MTWIVAKTMPYGYAVAVSDTRVTTDDGRWKDCLQKIFRVGPSMALGFAGCPYIGLGMVERLTELLNSGVSAPGGDDPEAVLTWWPDEARKFYEQHSARGETPQCELLLLSAHPTAHLGNPNWARCHVHRLLAPRFTPEAAEPDGYILGESKPISIGSGTGYERMLGSEAEFYQSQITTGFMVLEPSFALPRLLTEVRLTILREKIETVSPLIQVCTVSRGSVEIHDVHGEKHTATSIEHFTVPELAMDRVALDTHLKELGGLATARC